MLMTHYLLMFVENLLLTNSVNPPQFSIFIVKQQKFKCQNPKPTH